jgi:hypothetical protein
MPFPASHRAPLDFGPSWRAARLQVPRKRPQRRPGEPGQEFLRIRHAAFALPHDPEKWSPVFGKTHALAER